jgi:hypothetical protein
LFSVIELHASLVNSLCVCPKACPDFFTAKAQRR